MGYPERTEGVRLNRPGGRGQQPGVLGVGQGIYEKSDAPLHRIGDRLRLWGGRVFYYASFSPDSSAGDCDAGDVLAPDTGVNDLGVTTEVESYTTDTSNYDPAIGATVVEVVCTATKNQFQYGTFHITNSYGEGHTYLIKRNSATGEKLESDDPAVAAAADTALFELYDGLVIALTSASEIAVMGNLFANLAVSDGSDLCSSGVAMLTMDVSEDELYGWVQTWGPGTVLTNSTAVAKGDIMTASTTDGVAITMAGAYTSPIIGYALAAPTASGHCPIMLQIMPQDRINSSLFLGEW